ncbi:MAG TPA: hypothetical protein VMC83_41875 [Streptosporangiaceae bacterium]|nr:hypothetical protein [Streptosporangiaceae bacterium]
MARWWGLAGLTAAAVTAAGVAQTPAGHSALAGAGLFSEPASYTALSFAAPQSLPEQLRSAHAGVDASFVIRNSSGGSRSYQWSITVLRDGHTQRVASGTVRVRAGSAVTVPQRVAISCAGGRLRVAVNLTRPAESIDFQAACAPGKGNP